MKPRISLTLDPCCSLNIEPEQITEYKQHHKGGSRVLVRIDHCPMVFYVVENQDQVTAKILGIKGAA